MCGVAHAEAHIGALNVEVITVWDQVGHRLLSKE
jgi:hypothetical protein